MANTNKNTRIPNPSNPSFLNPRYEIRKLGLEHVKWAAALIIHSNNFHGPMWTALYPKNITDIVHRAYATGDYLWEHQIKSGMSFGVFDTEYKFKRPESEAKGGAIYWDPSEPSVQETKGLAAESARLLEQMDFPLVSVALSYDAMDRLDYEKMAPLMALLPHFPLLYQILAMKDKRDPNPSIPIAHGQILMRNATATRYDYQGEKLMSGLARWLMREADAKGYKGIQIETVHPAVQAVWSKPPEPYKGTVASSFHTQEWTDEEGKKPFAPANVQICKIFVDLKP